MRFDELRSLVEKCVRSLGYDESDVHTITSCILYAELRGNSQGLVKLVTGGVPTVESLRVAAHKQTHTARPSELTYGPGHGPYALVDGTGRFGMSSLAQATEQAAELCETFGVGVVGLSRGNGSTGAIGFFARTLAHRGYVAFVFSGCPPFVAAHGSQRRVFGTNPIAFACPVAGSVDDAETSAWSALTRSQPAYRAFHMDITTAAIAYYDVMSRSLSGTPLPVGTAIDETGRDTTDATRVLKGGAVKTFGEHRGSALALMVEILTGPLIGAGFAGVDMKNSGSLVIAVDPRRIGGSRTLERFTKQCTQLLDIVRESKPDANTERVRVPGQGGDKLLAARVLGDEDIPVPDDVQAKLRAVAKKSNRAKL